MIRKYQIGRKIPARDVKMARGIQHTKISSVPFDIQTIGHIHDINTRTEKVDLNIVKLNRNFTFFNMWHEALVPEDPIYELTN